MDAKIYKFNYSKEKYFFYITYNLQGKRFEILLEPEQEK